MFNFISKLATSEQKIQSIKRVTQENIDIPAFVLAADAAAGQIVRKFDSTLRVKVEDMPKSIQSEINALKKGVQDILNGVPFTANIEYARVDGSAVISSFALHSSTRKDIIYTPTTFECQCEGHEHHGVCKHRLVLSIFAVYANLLHIEEKLVRSYAKLGIELIPENRQISPTLNDSLENILLDAQQFFNEAYSISKDSSKLDGH
jgi:hypothetical protein